MNNIFGFLASPAGRIIRAIAGIILIAVGLGMVGGTSGAIIALVGIVPLVAGVFDFCIFATPFGYPFWGKGLRAHHHTLRNRR